MSDGSRPTRERPSKQARLEMMKEWAVGADGRSVARTFSVPTGRDASRLASRVVAFAVKHGTQVDIHSNGLALTVSMPSTGPQTSPTALLDRKQRGMAQRLERLMSRPVKVEADEQP